MLNNTRKKVLFLITKSNWGGAQRYVYDLATHLDHNKFEPVVALGGEGELVTMLNHAGIRVLTIASLTRDISLKQEWRFALELAKIIRDEKPDILHVNSSKAGGVGTFLGRILRVPKVIFTAHGWAFNEDRPLWQKYVIKALHYLTVLLSHRTIAVSAALMHQLNLPGVQEKMKVLHLGRSIGAMYEKDGARATLCQEFPPLLPHSNDVWIGSIAELHPVKQQAVLIKAMPDVLKTNPNVRLVLIGEGEERSALSELIVRLQLSSSVFLVGAQTEAARLLKAFDIFALASRSEAYGYVLHEAGLAGLPVVATNVGSIPEIVEHGVSGILVPSGDSAALGAALSKLLLDKPLCDTLAAALQKKMKERTLEKMVRATEILYTL